MTLSTPRPISEEIVAPDPSSLRDLPGAIQAIISILNFLRDIVARRLNDLLSRTSALETRSVLTQNVAIRHTTINYTMNPLDCVITCDASAAGVTIGLPRAQDVAGRVFYIKKIDATGIGASVTINPYGSETIENAATVVTTTQYDCFAIISDGVEWWIIGRV